MNRVARTQRPPPPLIWVVALAAVLVCRFNEANSTEQSARATERRGEAISFPDDDIEAPQPSKSRLRPGRTLTFPKEDSSSTSALFGREPPRDVTFPKDGHRVRTTKGMSFPKDDVTSSPSSNRGVRASYGYDPKPSYTKATFNGFGDSSDLETDDFEGFPVGGKYGQSSGGFHVGFPGVKYGSSTDSSDLHGLFAGAEYGSSTVGYDELAGVKFGSSSDHEDYGGFPGVKYGALSSDLGGYGDGFPGGKFGSPLDSSAYGSFPEGSYDGFSSPGNFGPSSPASSDDEGAETKYSGHFGGPPLGYGDFDSHESIHSPEEEYGHPHYDDHHHHAEELEHFPHNHKPDGRWRKKLIWKPRWKKVWKHASKQIWKPKWKRISRPAWKTTWKPSWKKVWRVDWKQIWKPVLVKQWVPGVKNHGVDFEGWEYTSHDLWRKKLIWKPVWKKVWKPVSKQIWLRGKKLIWVPAWRKKWYPAWKSVKVPAWKKVWTPVWISEWVPKPDHEEVWDRTSQGASVAQKRNSASTVSPVAISASSSSNRVWRFPQLLASAGGAASKTVLQKDAAAQPAWQHRNARTNL